jgi:hypothetical protein
MSPKSNHRRLMNTPVLNRRLVAVSATLAVAVTVFAACKTSEVLNVSTPDYLGVDAYSTPAGVDPLRFGVLSDFAFAYDGNTDGFTVISGDIADEITTTDTFDGRLTVNARRTAEINNEMESEYRKMQQAHLGAATATQTLAAAAPALKWQRGEMYVVKGFTEIFFGEGWCAGTAFSSQDGGTTNYGQPNTTQQLFQLAVASFDTAITLADTSKRVLYGAQLGRARALLALARYADAAATVANVPRSFQFLVTHSTASSRENNGMWTGAANGASRYSVITNEGINGLSYLQTPADPRMPWTASGRIGFDGRSTNLPVEDKFGRTTSGIVADGTEAQLDILEARLQGGTQADRDAVFDGLNALRTTNTPAVPAMAGSAPTTQDAAVTQLFTERAYWGWLTGKRLGDMRRLVRNYGRDAETVFPTGNLPVPLVGTYGTSTSLMVPFNERNNPNFTGCLDNKA